MSRTQVILLLLTVAAVLAWRAEAGDGRSVDDRLSSIEARLATVESAIVTMRAAPVDPSQSPPHEVPKGPPTPSVPPSPPAPPPPASPAAPPAVPPTAEKARPGYRTITKTFDNVKGNWIVKSKEIKVPFPGLPSFAFRSGPMFSLIGLWSGSRGPNAEPQAAAIILASTSTDWTFLKSNGLSLNLDGRRYQFEGDHDGEVATGYVTERITWSVTMEQLRAMSSAASGTGRAGHLDFKVTPALLQIISDFVVTIDGKE